MPGCYLFCVESPSQVCDISVEKNTSLQFDDLCVHKCLVLVLVSAPAGGGRRCVHPSIHPQAAVRQAAMWLGFSVEGGFPCEEQGCNDFLV
ncbi:hypothetical protein CBR_g18567 [Chara braunii]|uniref:Uncharacterized protein n=1 Tax=Chara braunii TaxID=69332 RepID=A0A388JT22_CHABU|nr:hypothetical protein CBR_g18567 [Chara braunii]|eukprot:GBG60969.1 hypothetical protein CBR_g18567 [Chara braunii]